MPRQAKFAILKKIYPAQALDIRHVKRVLETIVIIDVHETDGFIELFYCLNERTCVFMQSFGGTNKDYYGIFDIALLGDQHIHSTVT